MCSLTVTAQVLDIPGLDFKIQQLEISPEGSYLAIVGQKKISVCLLPLPGFARQSVERLRCHMYPLHFPCIRVV